MNYQNYRKLVYPSRVLPTRGHKHFGQLIDDSIKTDFSMKYEKHNNKKKAGRKCECAGFLKRGPCSLLSYSVMISLTRISAN